MTDFQNIQYISKVSMMKNVLMLFVMKGELNTTDNREHKNDALTVFNSINSLHISSTSIFSDQKWCFNQDLKGKVARLIEGSKLIIDFEKYPNIPKYVLFELKCIIYTLVNTPSLIRAKSNKLKVNTVFTHAKKGLSFIDHTFRLIIEKFGHDYIMSEVRSLSEISHDDFKSAALSHNEIYDNSLSLFLRDISSIFVRNNILSDSINANFVELKWNLVNKKNDEDSKKQVLPDFIFERLSFHSSRMIVEFLELIGEESDDLYSHKFMLKRYSQLKLTREILEVYKAIRLLKKGFPSEEVILRTQNLPVFCYKDYDNLYGGQRLVELFYDNYPFITLEEIRKYINEVSYCCSYIVAQYTGMRPSELSEIVVTDSVCLSYENGLNVIFSEVRKQELAEHALFDDAWVAIPIVVDAIRAASYISNIRNNFYLNSNVDTVAYGEEPQSMSSGFRNQMNSFISKLFTEEELAGFSFNQYMTRHTLAYQLFKADVGLAVISHQLKHLVDGIERYTSVSKTSDVTLGYGDIGDMLMKGERGNQNKSLRKRAERESIVSLMNPDGNYAGIQGKEHKKKLQRVFEGYSAEGYTKEDVYDAMLEQGIGIVNVGTGFCYGGEREDFDSNLPCIGTLRCNPVRCSNAIVTKAHAAKWREVYLTNKTNLSNPDYEDNHDQIREAMIEAEAVLQLLGENLTI
ncbi:hypothetical protein [Shewanella decolorationis]|uniref:Phage integrase family protein n=1 Tax=Shewanella decolorationis S12 TaxID=1353536 RepID=A0ABN0PNL0_9GAMM|nr:hypothetical protein [Shewanella decolorationis]ESE41669.1 phage integrase family protein [Shewanella decolorationis S12]GLR33735.1 hypothetical protein GCM10007922_32940 [Shewanella decolorationis]